MSQHVQHKGRLVSRLGRFLRNAVSPIEKIRRFRREFRLFELASRDVPLRFRMEWDDRMPCLNDRTSQTGFDRHYVFHTAWAARVLAATRPCRHVDISSSLYFCTIVSAFLPVEFVDYRPARLPLSGLVTGQADLCQLPFASKSLGSVSCMHVIEHVGLGRYGEPLDPGADLVAFSELQRVVAVNGTLIVVVPVGEPRICFNAHRIYAPGQVRDALPELALRRFALIPDAECDGALVEDPTDELVGRQRYGCGCFWFDRPEA